MKKIKCSDCKCVIDPILVRQGREPRIKTKPYCSLCYAKRNFRGGRGGNKTINDFYQKWITTNNE